MRMHKAMTNEEVAQLLRAVAAAYEIQGENLFRIRAYENAAASCEQSSREVKDLWEEGSLRSLPGIGSNIAAHLEELFSTGTVKHFKATFRAFPEAMFELLDIPGIGPKTAYKLTTNLRIRDARGAIPKIKQAAREGKIRSTEGFGEESEKAILSGISEYERRERRMLITTATAIATEIVEYMKLERNARRVEPLGSLRRRVATIGDIDIAVATLNPEKVIDHFTKFPKARKVLAAGSNSARLIHTTGQQIDIKTQNPRRFGSLLQHFTGSKAHNIHLREIAMRKGLSLSENGIKSRGKTREYATEAAFYQALGMQWIPPELREDTGEIETAITHSLPRLMSHDMIRGDLHLHTNYGWRSSHDSGTHEAKSMIAKAISLGYEYVGVGDHNPATANSSTAGLVKAVKERTEMISKLKEQFGQREKAGIYILNSLEVDILPDGELALPNEALQCLDYAVVSVHSSMRMGIRSMTERILKGLSHPKAKILGHPTGRLLMKREGYEVDWERVFRYATRKKKIIEINAWPARLDLPDTLVRGAVGVGVQLVITTDAHAPEHMDLMRFGVDVARRGWCTAKDIINTRPFQTIKHILTSDA